MGLLMGLLAFPLIWPFIAQRIWPRRITYAEMGLHIVGCTMLVGIVYLCGIHGKTRDTEVWNGQITGKERKHGTYMESYQCHCYTTGGKNPTTHCQTCYRTHYTVKWDAHSTLGTIRLDSEDWTSSGVYDLPNPKQYDDCQAGQPASLENSYDNYVKAVPDSLFHKSKADLKFQIPGYPRVFGYYRFNHVIADSAYDTTSLNKKLGNALRELGPSKQVNVIVFITALQDPQYMEAVQNAWVGGKKNDVLVFLGVTGKEINWTGAATWARSKGNELLAVHLRNELSDLKKLDDDKIVQIISESIEKYYVRPSMKDYEYLKDEIEPPTWVIALAALIAVLGSLLLTRLFYEEDIA